MFAPDYWTMKYQVGDCGEYQWGVHWVIPAKALAAVAQYYGIYVIQQIRKTTYIKDCNGNIIRNDWQEYWEVWFVLSNGEAFPTDKGTPGQPDESLIGIDDYWKDGGHPNTSGFVSISGDARVVVNWQITGFYPNEVPGAGSINSTLEEPQGWSKGPLA